MSETNPFAGRGIEIMPRASRVLCEEAWETDKAWRADPDNEQLKRDRQHAHTLFDADRRYWREIGEATGKRGNMLLVESFVNADGEADTTSEAGAAYWDGIQNAVDQGLVNDITRAQRPSGRGT